MRCWLLLLLTATLAYAQLYSPPIADVMQNNAGIGSALENSYDSTTAVSSTAILLPGVPAVSVSGSVGIADMSLMLDNATYPADGLAVLVAQGAMLGHLRSSLDGSICSYSSHASGCNFDTDACPEYESSTQVVYAGSVDFHFRNLTSSVPFSSTMVAVPQDVLDAMKTSSGAEQLNVSIAGAIHFVYHIDDPAGFGCSDNYYYVTRNLSFYASRNFTVFGANKLYFLRAPVLREQWFRDNRFDTIVLSQSPLYHADIWLNGNRTRNMSLRTFDIRTGAYGIQEIISNRTSPDGWSEDVGLTTPLLLEGYDNSFTYVYAFNYSYDGIGQNSLSLVVNDSFMGSERYNETLLSRMLSYNGTGTENGSAASSLSSRPSAAFSQGYMNSYEPVLGLLALLFILCFVNFWLLK